MSSDQATRALARVAVVTFVATLAVVSVGALFLTALAAACLAVVSRS